jgi:hypothetical protein
MPIDPSTATMSSKSSSFISFAHEPLLFSVSSKQCGPEYRHETMALFLEFKQA